MACLKRFCRIKFWKHIFKTEDNHESKKAKDNKNVADHEGKSKDYKNVLFNRSYMRHEMNRFQSIDHNVALYK